MKIFTMRSWLIGIHVLGIVLFSVTSYADNQVDVFGELEGKLMSAGPAVAAAAGLSDYTLTKAVFDGSFNATPLQLLNVITTTTPFSATSQAVCACTSGTYKLVAGSMGQVEVGESFSSSESLNTDTTVTVEASYGAVSAKATTSISTSKQENSSSSSQSLTQASTDTSGSKDLTCDKYNQPQCFIGTGSTDQLTYTDVSGSPDITYTYDVFPVNNGSTDFNAATFTATLYKAGATTAGPTANFQLYDGNNKLWYEQNKSPEPTLDYEAYAGNGDALFTSGAYKEVSRYNISMGGSPGSTVTIRFQNTKGQWTDFYSAINTGPQDIPKGWRGKDIAAVEYGNHYYITTGADTKSVPVKIKDAITYDVAKHTMTGIYNATDFTSLAVNMNFSQYSWSQLHRNPSQYTTGISQCGTTLVEAKRKWKASCSSQGKKVIMFKKWLNQRGKVTLPQGGVRAGGKRD